MAQVLIILAILFLATPAGAAQDALTNRGPDQGAVSPQNIAPEGAIVLPDGRHAVIQEILPNGQWRTDLGIVVPPVTLAPGMRVTLPDGHQATIEEILPNGQWRTDLGLITSPASLVPPVAQKPDVPGEPQAQESVAVNPGQLLPTGPNQAESPAKQEPPKQTIAPVVEGKAPQNPQYYTIAELLPTTQVPEKKAPEAKTPEKKIAPKEPEKKPVVKPEKAKEPEKKPVLRQEKPKEPAKKVEKPKAGQELRIPDQAAKTGNLDFLEGCWQGTRPEYYSKRTIKECFCFGAGGKNGKRRVLDYTQHRTCIGSSRASLSGNGVLRVISSGAVCSDGERWGQAEMVCRNSGPRTPCSWVFRDAQNGRQAYEIPFVRVESCGR